MNLTPSERKVKIQNQQVNEYFTILITAVSVPHPPGYEHFHNQGVLFIEDEFML